MTTHNKTGPHRQSNMPKKHRQIVAFSGGKDSTAMVLDMLDHGEPIDGLLVTPTGDELPDLWAHWNRIAALVGCELVKPPGPTLRETIDTMGALPNFRMRWCTRLIKIQPMIAWAKTAGDVVICVGLRADEPERKGIISESLACRFPLRERGIDIGGVLAILQRHGVKVPSRTDCARCYHQRIGEWWNLWRDHPDIWANAEADESTTGHTFRTPGRDTWPAALVELRAEFERGRVPGGTRSQLPLFQDEEVCRVCSL